MKNYLMLLLLCSQSAWSGGILSPEMDCDGLKNLIVTKNLKTIDAVIPELPKKYLRNPVMVYESNSFQMDEVSFEAPRVILFNEDGSMILAFTKNPGEQLIAKGKDSLEVICFNKNKMVYEFKDIQMNGKDTPFVDIQPVVNSNRCLNCHGSVEKTKLKSES